MAFEALTVSLQLMQALEPQLARLVGKDVDLARQARRAASSLHLNLAEGAQRRGNDRAHLYRIAAGSAAELAAALDVAIAWRWLDHDALTDALALLDRVRAILWRLTH
jgi:four helix bundle protein